MLPEVLSHALLVFVCALISVYAAAFILLTEGAPSTIQIGIAVGPTAYSYFFLETPIYGLIAATLTATVVIGVVLVGIVLRSYASMFRLSLLISGFSTLGIGYGILNNLPLLFGEIAAYALLLFITVLLGMCAYAVREQRYGNDADGRARNIPRPRQNEVWPPESGTGEGQFSAERTD